MGHIALQQHDGILTVLGYIVTLCGKGGDYMIKIFIEVDSEDVYTLKRMLPSIFASHNDASIKDEREYVDNLSIIEVRHLTGVKTNAINSLNRGEIKTIENLVNVKPAEVLKIRNMGPSGFASIVNALKYWLMSHSNDDVESWVKESEECMKSLS